MSPRPQRPRPSADTFPSAELLLKMISYRKPLQVTQIVQFSDGNSYPRCPRCNCTIEREYMRYCDRCGQCLEWNAFHLAKTTKKPGK